VGAFLLIFPGAMSDVLGVACFVAVYVSQRAAGVRAPEVALAGERDSDRV
jgi:UPF0716 family protein affecting phage T7 exclusion